LYSRQLSGSAVLNDPAPIEHHNAIKGLPRCQGSAARRWLEARQADQLPMEYYHVVFTLPAPLSALAWYNKTVIYGLLFDIAAETLRTIAADPKHLGASICGTLVLHTRGSALTNHPHVHGIVPGGGLSADGERWIACRPGFFLPVRALSRLFRRRFLEALEAAHRRGQLASDRYRETCLSGVGRGRVKTQNWSVFGCRFTLPELLPGRCGAI
jgi:hypothetical protein